MENDLIAHDVPEVVPELDKKEARQAVRDLAFFLLYNYSDPSNSLPMHPQQATDFINENYLDLVKTAGLKKYSYRHCTVDSQKVLNKKWQDNQGIAVKARVRDWLITEYLLKEALKAVGHGDTKAINETLSILKRRAAMTGYDAPQKGILVVEGVPQVTDESRARMMLAKKETDDFAQGLLGDGDQEEIVIVEGEFEEVEDDAT